MVIKAPNALVAKAAVFGAIVHVHLAQVAINLCTILGILAH